MSSQVASSQVARTGSLWDVMKEQGRKAGRRASAAAQQTKIRAELMLVDQKMTKRKEAFGLELYDSLVPHAESDPVFIIESDTLENIRGHFVTAFKDNKALLQKKARQQQELVELDEQRAVAYPKVPCETFGGQMQNAGKAANFARKEAACKNKIAVFESDMRRNKRKFGVEVYLLLCNLEDNSKWLSPDRDVRYLYDAARRDVTKMLTDKQQKQADLSILGLEIS